MKTRLIFVFGLVLLLAGCATNTISSIPEIDLDKVTKPKFEMLKDRSLALTLVDERSEKYRIDSDKWHIKVWSALRDIFAQSGIKIDEKSKNRLTVIVKDSTLPGQETNDCVEIKNKLQSKPFTMDMAGTACFSWQSHGGSHLDSDIGRAYEMALSMDFKGIDDKYEEVSKNR